MNRKQALENIRVLLRMNGNVIDKEILRIMFAHRISMNAVRKPLI